MLEQANPSEVTPLVGCKKGYFEYTHGEGGLAPMIEPVMFIQRGWRTMIEFVQWPDRPGRDQLSGTLDAETTLAVHINVCLFGLHQFIVFGLLRYIMFAEW